MIFNNCLMDLACPMYSSVTLIDCVPGQRNSSGKHSWAIGYPIP